MKTLLSLCLLLLPATVLAASIMPLADPFDISPRFLDQKLKTAIVATKLDPHQAAQHCTQSGANLQCDIVIFGQLIMAYGTESPPKISEIELALGWESTDVNTAKWAIFVVMESFDQPDVRANFDKVLDASVKCVNNNEERSIQGIRANFRLHKGQLSTCKFLAMTPR